MPRSKKKTKKNKEFGRPKLKKGNAVINIEKIATEISKMNRRQVLKEIKKFKGSFKLDFSDAYLDCLSTDKLHHILFAASLTKARSKKK